jgi:hypothetical protein
MSVLYEYGIRFFTFRCSKESRHISSSQNFLYNGHCPLYQAYNQAAPSLRHLIAEVRFGPRPVHEGFVVDKVTLGQVCLRVLRLSAVPLWLSMLIYHLGSEQ